MDSFNNRKREWLSVLIFITGTAVMCWNLFAEPRFFAEEGGWYYPLIRELNFFEALVFYFNGNLQLPVNIFVYLATKVPLLHAPLVTTVSSTLIAVIVAWQIGRFCSAYTISMPVSVLMALLWLFFPTGPEITYSTTNVHWVFGISALFVAITPFPIKQSSRYLMFFWILICSLSGIPAVLITPLFFVRAFTQKSKYYLICGLIFTLAASIQLYIVSISDYQHPYRALTLVPLQDITMSLLGQTLIGPIFGVDQGTKFLEYIILHQYLGYLIIGLFLGLCCYIAYRTKQYSLVAILVIAWFAVAYIQLFGALGRQHGSWHSIHPFSQGRYFSLSIMVVIIIYALTSIGKTSFISILFFLPALYYMAAYNYTNWHWQRDTNPSWSKEVALCNNKEPCILKIWPYSFHMPLNNPKILPVDKIYRWHACEASVIYYGMRLDDCAVEAKDNEEARHMLTLYLQLQPVGRYALKLNYSSPFPPEKKAADWRVEIRAKIDDLLASGSFFGTDGRTEVISSEFTISPEHFGKTQYPNHINKELEFAIHVTRQTDFHLKSIEIMRLE